MPARIWISLASLPDFAITPFFRVTQGYPLHKLPATYCPEACQQNTGNAVLLNRKVRPQLMGNCPYELARFSLFLLNSYDSVDLNFGCPAPKVVGHNGGSGLIKCTQNLRKFLECYFAKVPPGRISIKTRLGFECKTEASAILEAMNEFPIRELTLHGRTRAQKYTGKSDWELIAKLASKLHFPVTVSGDLCCFEDLKRLQTTCPNIPSVLVGRGAVRNPWLFQELRTLSYVDLEWGCLTKSMEVFLLINELCMRGNHQQLITKICELESSLETTSSSQIDYWCTIEFELLRLFAANHENRDFSKSSLARLKMIWNFFKTSLPVAFMNPALMRVANTADFFAFLDKIVQIEKESSEFLRLKYDPKHNWMFSGEKNSNDPASTSTQR